jgi:hypothetical protein
MWKLVASAPAATRQRITTGRVSSGALWVVAAVVLTVANVALFLLARGLVLDEHVNDLLHIADGASRIALGEHPHVDFRSPIGVLFFGAAPWASGAPLDVASLVRGLSLTWTAALVTLYLWVWWSRIGGAPALLVVPAIVIIGLGPRVLAMTSDSLTWAVPYNRWGMLGLALIMMFALPRRTANARHEYVDAAVIALALLALFFLKITFAAAAFAALLVIAIVRNDVRNALLVGTALALAVLALVDWQTGTVSAYLANVTEVARSPLRPTRTVGRVLALFFENGANLIVCLALIAATLATPLPWRERLLIIALTFIALGAAKQNHGHYALTLAAPVALLLRPIFTGDRIVDAIRHGSLGVAVVYFGAMLANQQWGLLQLFRSSFAVSAQAAQTRTLTTDVAATALNRVLPRTIPGITYNCVAPPGAPTPERTTWAAAACRPAPFEYLETLRHAARLTEQLGIPRSARVHTLDQINPVWWVSGRRSPKTIELWEFDADANKPLTKLSTFADFVFLPAYSIEPSVGAELKSRWQPHLEAQAQLVHVDALWQVWQVR